MDPLNTHNLICWKEDKKVLERTNLILDTIVCDLPLVFQLFCYNNQYDFLKFYNELVTCAAMVTPDELSQNALDSSISEDFALITLKRRC